MLNRRHLRVKVLQSLYAFFQTEGESYVHAEKELIKSIDKIEDLYLYLLLTFQELKQIAENVQEGKKNKLRPTDEDLNPNRRFIENPLIHQLDQSKELRERSELKKVNWIGAKEQEMFKKIFLNIQDSETYFAYMNDSNIDYEVHKAFILELFKVEIANSELLYHYFEEISINWMDDLDLVCSMVLKTLKGMQANEKVELLPLYKKDDDEKEFIQNLFRKTILMDKENETLIDELTQNWELDRIAKMDVILMKMAITELQVFNNIPTKVTLNEYIEISKFYSTPKSNSFINGILDKAIEKLTASQKIQKIGRGLKD